MIGQTELISKFNTFTWETLPKTIMLVGELGCGKHTFVSMLSLQYSVPIENISAKLTYEKISDLFLEVFPKIYIIDGQPTLAEQNSLLKFIEEPPTTAKIIILAETESSFLDTIVGRCQVFKFDRYSDEELLNFSSNEVLIKQFRTPGKLLQFKQENNFVFDLCNTILTKINMASIPNILTLSPKFNYGKDPDKFDISIFMGLLKNRCFELCKTDLSYHNCYLTINNWYDKMKIPNVDKQKLFELFLFDLKSVLRNDNTRIKTKN